MAYRLTQAAEEQIDAFILGSARTWDLDAAGRYGQLILAVMAALGDELDMLGSVDVPRLPDIRAYPTRLSCLRVEPARRVAAPRHLVIYCLASDDIVESLGLVHDHMVLSRAARKIVRSADKR